MTLRFAKSKEPSQLRAWIRSSEPIADRSWEDLRGEPKDAARTRLHRDQQGLCCYCYSRIPDDHTSHIEHVEPQNSHNRFDWENFALACEGGNQTGNPAHCDHGKDQSRLDVIHPYKAPVMQFVTLREQGKLGVIDDAARRDVDEVLNLNAAHLQRQRESARQAVVAKLARGKRRDEEWRRLDLEQILDKLRQLGAPIAYQPLLEAWLERRLGRAS
jgi:uncharacterized protein (TIGR02646 family)